MRRPKLVALSILSWLFAMPAFGDGLTVNVNAAQPSLRAQITMLSEITLKAGVTNIRFAGTGSRAQIIRLLHTSPAGTGTYSSYCVLEHDDEVPTRQWAVVPINQDAAARSECEEDWPWDGENSHKSVRFFNARYDNQPVSLLLISDRNGGHGKPPRSPETFYDPEYTTISIFKLQRSSSADGFSGTDHFALLRKIKTSREYCNADTALYREFAIPFPKSYVASNDVDGCLQR